MKYLFSTLFILCACATDRTAQFKQQPIVPQEVVGPQGPPGPMGPTGPQGPQGLPGTCVNGSSCSVYTIKNETLWLCDQAGCTQQPTPKGIDLWYIKHGGLILCTDGSLFFVDCKYDEVEFNHDKELRE